MGYNYICILYHWALIDWEQIQYIMKQTGSPHTLILDLENMFDKPLGQKKGLYYD